MNRTTGKTILMVSFLILCLPGVTAAEGRLRVSRIHVAGRAGFFVVRDQHYYPGSRLSPLGWRACKTGSFPGV